MPVLSWVIKRLNAYFLDQKSLCARNGHEAFFGALVNHFPSEAIPTRRTDHVTSELDWWPSDRMSKLVVEACIIGICLPYVGIAFFFVSHTM